jgi:pimeloyl-ACP methyl ester carboxylesterase
VRALAQGAPASNASAEEFFYREDWFGEPWRKPETAVLIHGNEESSIVWYAWMPRMAQEFRVLRPDLPGLGRSRIPVGFEWSLPSLASFVARVLDKAGVDSAHIIGAKAGGAIAMQFAADYPARTRTLSVVHVPSVGANASGPASVISVTNPREQLARLGSAASKEMVDYWENMFATAPKIPTKGLLTAVYKSDLVKGGVLQRIKAPTLLMTADRDQSQSVEKARQYQTIIPNSPGGTAERCLPYCRRECRRVRHQRSRFHQGGETQGLAARCGTRATSRASCRSGSARPIGPGRLGTDQGQEPRQLGDGVPPKGELATERTTVGTVCGNSSSPNR